MLDATQLGLPFAQRRNQLSNESSWNTHQIVILTGISKDLSLDQVNSALHLKRNVQLTSRQCQCDSFQSGHSDGVTAMGKDDGYEDEVDSYGRGGQLRVWGDNYTCGSDTCT